MRCTCGYDGGACEACAEDLRDDGRREMLWLMAVGAAWRDEQVHAHDGYVSAICAARTARTWALSALADLGDEQALELLR